MGHSGIITIEELLENTDNSTPILLLDTNILLAMMENPELVKHVEEELGAPVKVIVAESVLRELENLSKSSIKIRKLVKTIGLQLLKDLVKLKSIVISSADRDLEELASLFTRRGFLVIVATNDVELRRRLRKRGIHTAFTRKAHKRLQTSLGRTV